MKRLFALTFLLYMGLLQADSPLVPPGFFDEFLYEQKQDLANAGITNPPPGTIAAPPGPPTSNPLPPAPLANMLPVVLNNTTGLPDNQVYVTLAGQEVAGSTQFFFQLNPSTGVFTPVPATSSTYSPNYSYPLSSFPVSTTSTTSSPEYLAYVPSLAGARFYFSIQQPMYLQSDTPNAITAPTYYAFYDPNYSNLYETIELTFNPTGGSGGAYIPWTASVNTTEVDAFCFPIRIGYFSYNPASPGSITPMIQDSNALPSGFGVGGLAGATTRQTIINSVKAGLQAGDMSGGTPPVWPRLLIPFYQNPYAGGTPQTYLRILSPKQSLGNNAAPQNIGGLTNQRVGTVDGSVSPTFLNYSYPPFPLDYLSGSYGAPSSFADSLFGYYTGATALYLSTGGGSPTVYEGTSIGSPGSYTLSMTGITGPNTGQVNTLVQYTGATGPTGPTGPANILNTFEMYSGSQAFAGGSDQLTLGFYFGDAFTVGMLPSPVGTNSSTPIDITDATATGWEATNIGNYYVAPNSPVVSGGPWYDLYAKELHKVAVRNTSSTFLNGYGLCYAYDFDDSLGISGTITPVITTLNSLNPYLKITLGSIDTPIPNPYSDTTAYTMTFTFDSVGGHTLSYQQGSGPVTSVTSGTPIAGLQSNSTNPLRLFYNNGQPSGSPYTHEFIIYPLYQILVPIGSYNSSEITIINSTTITFTPGSPPSFTVNILP
ncbi:MAG: hypothetical protein JSR39_10100 [Verrucomicrobia bacterium]|nr:hypothetical protein [Verrucomicrobiota bacterium]